MKLDKTVILLSALLVGNSFGAAGIFGTYINITSTNFSSGSAVWYDAQAPGGTRASNPTDFQGFDFGAYNPSAGGALSLTGAEVLTFKNGNDDVAGASILYRVYSSAPPSFSNINAGFTADQPFSDAATTNYSGAGDQKWSNGVGTTDLLAGLSAGSYLLEAYFQAETSTGLVFSNNAGSNFIARFSVVPEPTSALLATVGALALLRRRRI